VVSYDGAEILITVFTSHGITTSAPCIYAIHRGGMVMGDGFMGMSQMLPWAVDNGPVLTAIEYRLSPEHPDPTPVEDC
jgi:acetyl esterase/lipase